MRPASAVPLAPPARLPPSPPHRLRERRGGRPPPLFGREPGARGDIQYMAAVGDERDRRTGVPVHSLYGSKPASLRPDPGTLRGLDALVFDIQDIGARSS